MKRGLRLLWAQVRCELYLLTLGLVRREVKFTEWGPDGRLRYLATVTNLNGWTRLQPRRVFWNENAQGSVDQADQLVNAY